MSSAFDYCRELDLYVDVDPELDEDLVCGMYDDKLTAIWLPGNSNERRLNFSCAHELGHAHMNEPVSTAALEALADRFAAALLMPAWEFMESVRERGVDLHALHRHWRFCSMGAIASRVGELMPHAAAAGWLELHAEWRHSTIELDEEFRRMELEALGEVYHRPRGATEIRSRGRVVRAWRTHAMRPRRAISVCQSA